MVVSIVCVVHNGEHTLDALYHRIVHTMDQFEIDWELILIDDGSKDLSAYVIQQLYHTDVRVSGIRLSRRFGFQGAVMAGMDVAQGDAVVVMDLQTPPEVIPQMMDEWKNGAQVVYGIPQTSRLMQMIMPVNFCLMDRHIVEAMPERNHFFRRMKSPLQTMLSSLCFFRPRSLYFVKESWGVYDV